MTPNIVIIGRRNVGKSALFNRLIEQEKAIVSNIEGTTRDRTEADCIWRAKTFRIVDTGGLDIGDDNTIDKEIKRQTAFAIKKADVIIFLVDARIGPQPSERMLAKELYRKSKDTPIILVANKAETEKWRHQAEAPEWRTFKLGIPHPISALTGQGVGDLLDEIIEKLPNTKKGTPTAEEPKKIKIAIIGKPNVGKSSMLNKILGEDRVIVSPIAHTTREPQDTLIEFEGKKILLIDTAGIRRRAKINKGIEKAGVSKTLQVISQADVVLFVVDAHTGIDFQDKHLAGMVREVGVGIVIVANKLDLLPERDTKEGDLVKKTIHGNLPGLSFAPIAFTSALSGHHVQKLIKQALEVYDNRYRVIPETELEELLPKLILRHKPTKGKGTNFPIIRRIEQIGITPPQFLVVIGPKQSIHQSYIRYLENRLREFYDFAGTPIKIEVKNEISNRDKKPKSSPHKKTV